MVCRKPFPSFRRRHIVGPLTTELVRYGASTQRVANDDHDCARHVHGTSTRTSLVVSTAGFSALAVAVRVQYSTCEYE
eukprot:scaffold337756_cov24-Prasinocladus_malaysianus.AAC.1